MKKDRPGAIKVCGSLATVTNIIPAPDLLGKTGAADGVLTEAMRIVAEPWAYVRSRMRLGLCALVLQTVDRLLIITKKLTLIVDPTDLYIYGCYKTDVKLIVERN